MRSDTTAGGPDYDRIIEDLTYTYDGVFSEESVAQAVAEARAALEPVSRIPTYLPILTARYATTQATAAAQAEGRITKQVPEPALRLRPQRRTVPDRRSAGPAPVRRSRPRPLGWLSPVGEVSAAAVAVLEERGIDLSEAYPKPLTNDVVRAADVVITMGCGDACPILPGKRYEDWDVADPAGQPLETVRDIRDDIQARVTRLLRDLGI